MGAESQEPENLPGVGWGMSRAPCSPDRPVVAVTRAAGTNGDLAALLRAGGLEVVEVPLIRFTPPGDVAAWHAVVQARLAAAGDQEWLAVTSPQAARALLDALSALGAGPAAGTLRLAVVGAGTAAVLEALGLHPAFQPSRAEATVLGAELPARPGEVVWHLTSQRSEPALGEALTARGVGYRRAEAYRTEPVHLSSAACEALRRADAVVLASGSAVRAMAAQVGVGSMVVVMGEPSAQVARALGFRQVVVAARAGLHELARAVLTAVTPEGTKLRPDQLSDRSVRDE